MRIELDVKVPRDNTNANHGNVNIRMDNRFAYIRSEGKDIIVDAEELFRAVNALYKN